MQNGIKSFSACSGFFTSVKLPQVFTIPTTKNNTSRASPIACNAPWILTMTFQIVPPLKFSGSCNERHISDSFSFQVSERSLNSVLPSYHSFDHLLTITGQPVNRPPLCLVSLGYLVSACDKSQNFFRKGDDDAARKGQKAICPLGRVVGFQGQTNLHDTKAEQNHTDRTD